MSSKIFSAFFSVCAPLFKKSKQSVFSLSVTLSITLCINLCIVAFSSDLLAIDSDDDDLAASSSTSPKFDNTKNAFHELPPEVLTEIFSFLDHQSVAAVAGTCVKFNEVTKEEAFKNYQIERYLFPQLFGSGVARGIQNALDTDLTLRSKLYESWGSKTQAKLYRHHDKAVMSHFRMDSMSAGFGGEDFSTGSAGSTKLRLPQKLTNYISSSQDRYLSGDNIGPENYILFLATVNLYFLDYDDECQDFINTMFPTQREFDERFPGISSGFIMRFQCNILRTVAGHGGALVLRNREDSMVLSDFNIFDLMGALLDPLDNPESSPAIQFVKPSDAFFNALGYLLRASKGHLGPEWIRMLRRTTDIERSFDMPDALKELADLLRTVPYLALSPPEIGYRNEDFPYAFKDIETRYGQLSEMPRDDRERVLSLASSFPTIGGGYKKKATVSPAYRVMECLLDLDIDQYKMHQLCAYMVSIAHAANEGDNSYCDTSLSKAYFQHYTRFLKVFPIVLEHLVQMPTVMSIGLELASLLHDYAIPDALTALFKAKKIADDTGDATILGLFSSIVMPVLQQEPSARSIFELIFTTGPDVLTDSMEKLTALKNNFPVGGEIIYLGLPVFAKYPDSEKRECLFNGIAAIFEYLEANVPESEIPGMSPKKGLVRLDLFYERGFFKALIHGIDRRFSQCKTQDQFTNFITKSTGEGKDNVTSAQALVSNLLRLGNYGVFN